MGNIRDGMRVRFDAVIVHASKREAGEKYERISQNWYLAEKHCREEWVMAHDARHHPREITYCAPATSRAIAHALEHLPCVITGFGALGLYGLPFLVDGADTTLLCAKAVNRLGTSMSPTLRRRSRAPLEIWRFEHRGVEFRAASPSAALVHALQDVKSGAHRWKVSEVEGMAPEQVMAVQLVDCCRRFLKLSPAKIRTAASGKLDRHWLNRILAASSSLADSPKETEVRLLLQAVAAEFGYTVQEQVKLVEDGKLITIFDLVIPEAGVAVMYDGEHHWDYQQRQKDATINLKADLHGWRLVRCSSSTMLECVGLVRDILRQKVHGPAAVE